MPTESGEGKDQRFEGRRDDRDEFLHDSLGFRFALRSTNQERAAGAERLQQDFKPEGPEAPQGLAAFPGREGSAAAVAGAEAAASGFGKLRKKIPKGPGKKAKS